MQMFKIPREALSKKNGNKVNIMNIVQLMCGALVL